MQYGRTHKKVRDVGSYGAALCVCGNTTVRRERSKRRRSRDKAIVASAHPTTEATTKITPSPHRR